MISRNEVRSLGGTAQNELAAPRNSPAAATLALMLSPAAPPTVLVNPWRNRISSKQMTALRTVTGCRKPQQRERRGGDCEDTDARHECHRDQKILGNAVHRMDQSRKASPMRRRRAPEDFMRNELCMIRSTMVIPIARSPDAVKDDRPE